MAIADVDPRHPIIAIDPSVLRSDPLAKGTHSGDVPSQWAVSPPFMPPAIQRGDMYRILMPVDADEGRSRAQARFATSLPGDADDVLVRVLFVFSDEGEDLPDELSRYKSADRIGSVRRATEHLEDAGIEVEIAEESGKPAQLILEAADDFEADLILLGGRKRSPVGKAIFGSVAQSVILETDRPVAVTGGE